MVIVEARQLFWDNWNINHIKKHKVKPEEVEQAIESKTKTLESYQKRLLVLGQTKSKRLLTVVLAPEKNNKYYLITARDMNRKERRYYNEQKNS